MSTPKGEHSSRRKGDNGTVDLKASGMTTEMTEGPYTAKANTPDASRKTVVSSA